MNCQMYLGVTLLLERIWKYIFFYHFPRTKTILWFPHCGISGLAFFLGYSSHWGLWIREVHPLGKRWRKRNCTVIQGEYELCHLHEQGAKGDRDRWLMARKGKVISECHKCSWRVRKWGDLCSRSLNLHYCTPDLRNPLENAVVGMRSVRG